MSQHPYRDQRSEERKSGAARVHFFVNDGAEQISNTINFTRKSLAIRSNVRVRVGDKVRAMVEHLPILEGTVKRVWKEGFAISLIDEASALFDHSHSDEALERKGMDAAEQAQEGEEGYPTLVMVDAPDPCWFGICRPHKRPGRPRLVVITSHHVEMNSIRSVWFTISDMRSSVRVLKKWQRNKKIVILVRIHDWQIEHARQHGLTVSIISHEYNEWWAHAAPEAIEKMLVENDRLSVNVA